MSALSDNVQVSRKDGEIIAHPCAVDTVYEGALVKQNAAGYLAPCAAEAGAVFAGVAVEKVANESPYAAGDQKARVYKKGVFLLTGSGFAQTDVGQAVYATDDQTITKTYASNIQRVGVIVEFESSTKVWVKIEPQVFGLEAAITDGSDAGSTQTAVNSALAVLRKHNMIQV